MLAWNYGLHEPLRKPWWRRGLFANKDNEGEDSPPRAMVERRRPRQVVHDGPDLSSGRLRSLARKGGLRHLAAVDYSPQKVSSKVTPRQQLHPAKSKGGTTKGTKYDLQLRHVVAYMYEMKMNASPEPFTFDTKEGQDLVRHVAEVVFGDTLAYQQTGSKGQSHHQGKIKFVHRWA